MLREMTAKELLDWELWYATSELAHLGTGLSLGGGSGAPSKPQTIEEQKAIFATAKGAFDKASKR